MKKLLLILLLVILPLQSGWAAAGAYCQHESGATSKHIGHHFHQHQSVADLQDSKGDMSKAHNDCSSCHGVGCALFVIAALDVDVIPVAREYIAPRPFSYTSHIPDGPRRPDRLSVA